MMEKDLISEVLSASESDTVAAPTDDLCQQEMESTDFQKLFDRRVEVHGGFSAKLSQDEPGKKK
jgi:hypothetical protein